MPTVPKTSPAEIVRAARSIVARDGLSGLSLQAVANVVGVRAPSLYKHFSDRAALVRAVASDVLEEVTRVNERAATTGSPEGDLRALARAQRKFALTWPRLYVLAVSTEEVELPAEAHHRVVAVLMDRVAQLVPPRRVLPSARMLVAFMHGFISMEIAGRFRMGGDLDAAFNYAVDQQVGSLTRAAAPPSKRR